MSKIITTFFIILIFSVVSSHNVLAQMNDLQQIVTLYNRAIEINHNKAIELLTNTEDRDFIFIKTKEVGMQTFPQLSVKGDEIVFSVDGVNFQLKVEDLKVGKFSVNGTQLVVDGNKAAKENYEAILNTINKLSTQTSSFDFSLYFINEAHSTVIQLTIVAIVLFILCKKMMTPYKLETVEYNPRIEQISLNCQNARSELQSLKNAQPEAIRNYLSTHKKLLDQSVDVFEKQISSQCVSSGKGLKNTNSQCMKNFKEGENCIKDIKRINAELEAIYSGASNVPRNKIIKKIEVQNNGPSDKKKTIGK